MELPRHENESGLAGAEEVIYQMLLSKTSFNTPKEALPLAKHIFHCLDSLQGRDTHAQGYQNLNAELDSTLVSANALALAAGISPELAEAILVRFHINKVEGNSADE